MVYRLKFAMTPFAARQFINHGHIKVNGRRVTIPSYLVNEGDVIEVKEKSRDLVTVLEALDLKERDVPDYLSLDVGRLYVRAHTKARRRALSGPDGTQPGDRVLLAVAAMLLGTGRAVELSVADTCWTPRKSRQVVIASAASG